MNMLDSLTVGTWVIHDMEMWFVETLEEGEPKSWRITTGIIRSWATQGQTRCWESTPHNKVIAEIANNYYNKLHALSQRGINLNFPDISNWFCYHCQMALEMDGQALLSFKYEEAMEIFVKEVEESMVSLRDRCVAGVRIFIR